ncbi:MAG: TolC family protein [Cytophagales bacterium]|nr:TolC family protein [Bernardetiaceae bacterium]MDW8210956.1 TolC family protein [Cytophagales bacterium]
MTNVQYSWLVAVALSFLCKQTFGQDHRWDLQRCINYALENNLQLKNSLLAIEAAQVNLLQSKMARLPNLNLGANQQWNQGRSIDFFTNLFTTQSVANFNISLNTNLIVFNGFRLSNAIKQNTAALQASQLDVAQAKNELMLNVVSAYLQVLLNKELLEVARTQLQTTVEQLQRTTNLIKAGALAEANQYDLLAQKANDQARLAVAENNFNIAIGRLKLLLQLPLDTPFEVVVPTLPDPSPQDLIMPPSEIFAIAQTHQPNVLSADKNVEVARYGIDLARGNAMPTISLFGSVLSGTSSQTRTNVFGAPTVTVIGFLTDDPTKTVSTLQSRIISSERTPYWEQLQNNFRNSIGFQIQVPIFNRYQVRTNIANAKIQHQRSQLQAEIVRNQLRQTIEQAYADAKAAQSQFIANQTRLKTLQDAFKIAEQRFNAGAINALEYTLARNNLNIAESDLVRAKFEYIFRMKILDFYAGKELKL